MLYSVYRITNTLNGKVYIGLTSKLPSQRWRKHCNNASLGSPFKFHRAIQKYGPESFILETLYDGIDLETARRVEIAEIAKHQSVELGYNTTRGGTGSEHGWSSDSRERQRIRVREWAANRSEGEIAALRDRVKKQWAGLSEDDLTAMKKKMASRKARRYRVISPDGVEFDVTNLKEFCTKNGLHQGQLCGVANGRYSHCKGWLAFHWD